MATATKRAVKRAATKAAAKNSAGRAIDMPLRCAKFEGDDIDFSKGALRIAINASVEQQIAHAGTTWGRFFNYVAAIRRGEATPAHASEIVHEEARRLIARRKAKGIVRKDPDVSASRISAVKSVLQLANWDMVGAVFAALKNNEPSEDDLVHVSRYLRKAYMGKRSLKTAPPTKTLLDVINLRKRAKDGKSRKGKTGTGGGKLPDAVVRHANLTSDVASFMSAFKKELGAKDASLVTGMLENLGALKAPCAAIMKARAKAKAEKAAADAKAAKAKKKNGK